MNNIRIREAHLEDKDEICSVIGKCLSGKDFPLTSIHDYWNEEERKHSAKKVCRKNSISEVTFPFSEIRLNIPRWTNFCGK